MPRALLTLLVLLFTFPAVAGPQALLDPEAALAQSQATGRPVLAIAGSTGCIWCKKMAAELATGPAVQEAANKFVVLLLDTDDPVRWPKWNAHYKVEGEGIPAVFVVRADGEQIYGGNGAPKDLADFLDRRLEDAGTVLDDAALAELTAASRNLSKSWRRRDPKEVIPELTKRLDPKNHSAPARQIALIAEQMRKLADDRLSQAERDLEAADRKPDAAFEAAVTALSLRRDYSEFPESGDAFKNRVDALEKGRATAPLFAQAAKVLEAEALFEGDKRAEAISALKSLAADQPGSAAAKYAIKTLGRWEKGKRVGTAEAAADSDAEAPATEPTVVTTEESVERAAAQLRLGKRLLDSNPSRAKTYFERAIELAPGSPTAAEAAELLGR